MARLLHHQLARLAAALAALRPDLAERNLRAGFPAARRTSSISASVSLVKRLSATTGRSPQTLGCCADGGADSTGRAPALPRFSSPSSALRHAAVALEPARTVATSTTALGTRFAMRHLMSINFSAPRSAPKPASVTTTSARRSAVWVAITVLQPWAMLANGRRARTRACRSASARDSGAARP